MNLKKVGSFGRGVDSSVCGFR